MKRKILLNGLMTEFEANQTPTHIEIMLEGQKFLFDKKGNLEDQIILSLNSVNFKGETASMYSQSQVFAGNLEAVFEIPKNKAKALDHSAGPVSPMPGKVFKVMVKNGDKVKKGDGLMILEAMKMEHTIKASSDGVVKKVLFKEGDMVLGGVTLVEIGN